MQLSRENGILKNDLGSKPLVALFLPALYTNFVLFCGHRNAQN